MTVFSLYDVTNCKTNLYIYCTSIVLATFSSCVFALTGYVTFLNLCFQPYCVSEFIQFISFVGPVFLPHNSKAFSGCNFRMSLSGLVQIFSLFKFLDGFVLVSRPLLYIMICLCNRQLGLDVFTESFKSRICQSFVR